MKIHVRSFQVTAGRRSTLHLNDEGKRPRCIPSNKGKVNDVEVVCTKPKPNQKQSKFNAKIKIVNVIKLEAVP